MKNGVHTEMLFGKKRTSNAANLARFAGVGLALLFAVVEARGDVAPDPRLDRTGVSGDAGVWLTLGILCAALGLLLRALWRAALRWAGEEAHEGAPSSTGQRKRRYRKPAVYAGAVVFLLGFGSLATMVVKDFMNFRLNRLKDKNHEARSNLGAIRSTEVAYFAEWNVYVGNQRATPPADPRAPLRWRSWDPDTRFSLLGFAPEGGVYCSYLLEGPDFPVDGFIARAECDLDGDGEVSVYTVTAAGTEMVKSGAPF